MQEFGKSGGEAPASDSLNAAEVRLDTAEYELRRLVSQLETVLRDAGIARQMRADAEAPDADQFEAFAAATRTGSAR